MVICFFLFSLYFFSVSRAYAGRRGEHWQTRFSRLRNRRRRRRLGFLCSRCRDEKNKIKYTLFQFRILDNKGHSEIRVKDNATLKCKRKIRIPIYITMYACTFLIIWIAATTICRNVHMFLMTRLLQHIFVFRFTVALIIIVWPLSSPIIWRRVQHIIYWPWSYCLTKNDKLIQGTVRSNSLADWLITCEQPTKKKYCRT